MPGFKDLLRKKDKIASEHISTPPTALEQKLPQASEFTFVRTDTHTEEVLHPPFYDGDDSEPTRELAATEPEDTTPLPLLHLPRPRYIRKEKRSVCLSDCTSRPSRAPPQHPLSTFPPTYQRSKMPTMSPAIAI
jgi:hypothetical protein